MNTKLTLTIEQSIIEKAKKYAKKQNRSLSQIIEYYLRTITKGEMTDEPCIDPEVAKLRGIVKLEKDANYKKLVEAALSEKYKI